LDFLVKAEKGDVGRPQVAMHPNCYLSYYLRHRLL